MLGSMQYPLSLAQLVQKAPSALHCGERRIWASPAYAGCISFGSAKARSAHLHLCRTFPPLLVILHNGRAVCPCLIGSGVRDWAPSASCCHPSQPAGRAVCCTQFLLRLLRGSRRLAVPAPCGRTFRWWMKPPWVGDFFSLVRIHVGVWRSDWWLGCGGGRRIGAEAGAEPEAVNLKWMLNHGGGGSDDDHRPKRPRVPAVTRSVILTWLNDDWTVVLWQSMQMCKCCLIWPSSSS